MACVSLLSGEGEVVQAGDAEHGVVNTVAFQAAVAEDLPVLHAGEGVLDAGADFAVGGVVFLFPGRQFGLPAFAAVRDDQAGAPVAAVRDHRRLADGVLGAGQLPCLAVVAVARQRPADGDDEPGVGVDDDLVVGRVPVVLRLLGDGVVAGGDQGSVHDQHGVLAEPLALLERERRPEVVDDAVGGRLRHPEQWGELAQRQVGPPVGGDQQHPVLKRQAPWPPLADRVRTFAPQRGDQLAELTRTQPGERDYPGRLRRRDHTSHSKIISSVTGSYGTTLRTPRAWPTSSTACPSRCWAGCVQTVSCDGRHPHARSTPCPIPRAGDRRSTARSSASPSPIPGVGPTRRRFRSPTATAPPRPWPGTASTPGSPPAARGSTTTANSPSSRAPSGPCPRRQRRDWALDRNRQITPSNCSRSRSGYGPYSPIGRYGSMNSPCSTVSCLRVTPSVLPGPATAQDQNPRMITTSHRP